jgi:hypothetical protein
VTQNVVSASTTTALTNTPSSSVFGQEVTLTATVSVVSPAMGTPTGQVEFFNGSTSLGFAALVGNTATFPLTNLPPGTLSLTSEYEGDSQFAASTSPAVTQTVTQASTTTTLANLPSSSIVGQSVALTATVAVVSPGTGTPTGSIEFFNGINSLGVVPLTGTTAILNTTALPPGTLSLTARYSGDTNYTASTSVPVTQTVTASATSTTVTANPDTPAPFEPVTLTATVVPTSGTTVPTGTVEFFSNGISLGTSTLTNGQATLVATFDVGLNIVTARYLGDSGHAASTSPEITVAVGDATQIFIDSVFVQLLGRNADEDELAFWTEQLDAGRSRRSFVNTLSRTREAQDFTTATIFEEYFGRPATEEEIRRYQASAKSLGTGVRAAILGSRQYFNLQGQGSIEGFLTALGFDTTGTFFNPNVEAFLSAQLAAGASRLQIAQQALLSGPSRRQIVEQTYDQVLEREPTNAERAADVAVLGTSLTPKQLKNNLLASTEYFILVTGEDPVAEEAADQMAAATRRQARTLGTKRSS